MDNLLTTVKAFAKGPDGPFHNYIEAAGFIPCHEKKLAASELVLNGALGQRDQLSFFKLAKQRRTAKRCNLVYCH
ncbi:MAG TPA: hypothetical protein VNI02_18340 [Blastocatellia bacterium]|nr:hypothetical protein [Blastocatellia bacterium]